jgi:hypothetical protein
MGAEVECGGGCGGGGSEFGEAALTLSEESCAVHDWLLCGRTRQERKRNDQKGLAEEERRRKLQKTNR